MIQTATVTVQIRHFTDDEKKECIFIEQVLAAGIRGTTENRYLDWQSRVVEDRIFGTVSSRSKRVPFEELVADKEVPAFFKEGWDDETKEAGVVYTSARNEDNNWTASQAWGFAMVEVKDGPERRYVRRVRIVKDDGQETEFRMIYDFKDELPVSPASSDSEEPESWTE